MENTFATNLVRWNSRNLFIQKSCFQRMILRSPRGLSGLEGSNFFQLTITTADDLAMKILFFSLLTCSGLEKKVVDDDQHSQRTYKNWGSCFSWLLTRLLCLRRTLKTLMKISKKSFRFQGICCPFSAGSVQFWKVGSDVDVSTIWLLKG